MPVALPVRPGRPMTLWSLIARITSSVETLYARMRSGLSQTRIANWRLPRMLARPMPEMRCSSGRMFTFA